MVPGQRRGAPGLCSPGADAPAAHLRPGCPSVGCAPAEPTSVSPGGSTLYRPPGHSARRAGLSVGLGVTVMTTGLGLAKEWPFLVSTMGSTSGDDAVKAVKKLGLTSAPRGPAHHRPLTPRCRPRLEALEDRCLLSGGVLDPTFGTGGVVTTSMGSIHSYLYANAVATYPQTGTADDGKVVAAGVVNPAYGKYQVAV